MLGGTIRFLLITVVAALWCVATYWAVSSIRHIWAVRNVDTGLTLRLIGKALIKNPFASLIEQVRESADLQVSWTAQEGYAFTPQGGEVITAEFLQDRRQYLLLIANPGKESLGPVELRLQFPYPVDRSEVARSHQAEGVTFAPVGMLINVGVGGGGEVRVMRRPLSANYELRIAELRPQGRVEILLALNRWRDPLGKTIPKEEQARYFVPEWGPTVTYIHGSFKHRAGTETVGAEFYAPFELRDDKTVVMGAAGPRPEHLAVRMGLQ